MVQLQLVFVSVFLSLNHQAFGSTVNLVSASVLASNAIRCDAEPSHRVDCYPPSPNFPGPTEELCLAQGCCWQSLENGGVPCAFAVEDSPEPAKCKAVDKPSRLACRNPRFALAKVLQDAETCETAGCCFDDGECFQPKAEGYELLTLDETNRGWRGTLALRTGNRGPFGNDAPLLELNVDRYSARQVRIRITDPAFRRYEVPNLPVQRQQDVATEKEDDDYQVHFTPWPFGVAVTRRDSGDVLFNSTPPVESEDEGKSFSGLVFENQFLEISTQLAASKNGDEPVLYGLGERLGSARLRADDEGDLYPMFARAPNGSAPVHTRSGGDNLYGVHPFVMQLEDGQAGNAHGIFMLSSNAMEVVSRRDALTYRLTGGILDIFVFSGPTPEDVIEQYTEVVGRPAMPPYWALGYHVGRRGGEAASIGHAVELVTKLRMAGVPMDAYWQDYEYMASNGRALSLDESKFPHREMRAFIEDLHFHSQYFVCVQVPSISLSNTSMTAGHGNTAKNSGLTNLKNAVLLSQKDGSDEDKDAGRGAVYEHDEEDDGYDFDSVRAGSEREEEDSTIGSDGWNSGNSRRSSSHRSDYGDEAGDRSDEGGSEVGEDGWDPIARGEELDVFVKGVNGERYAQKASRRGWAVFVDFFHPKASRYWHEQLAMFYRYVMPFDGLWLDMNEPSGVCDCTLAAEVDICAHICNEQDQTSAVVTQAKRAAILEEALIDGDGGFIRTNDVNFPFDPYRQPFAPGQNDPVNGGHGNLNSATLPMAALHHSSLHYNLHSLYGHEQTRATRHALDSIVKKRSLLLSRSTFSGSGRYAGHWLADHASASWEQMRLSISGTLQMNVLGVPLTGPNVCGSRGQSSRELCVRWHQAASFLPLLRNHDESGGEHAPVDFDAEALNILRSTLLRRYRYLPYMYTLFYMAHRSGSPVVRPLAFEFPDDVNGRSIEHQYLLGPALMISPVVHEGAISVEVFFPDAYWYDADSGKEALNPAAGDNRRVSLLTPLPKLQVHLRGGFIVPTQQPLSTTALSRRGAFTLLAALHMSQETVSASGELYVDDGDSLSAMEDNRYSLMCFDVYQNTSDTIEFKSSLLFHGYAGPEMHADVKEIRVYGVYGDGFASNSSMKTTLLSRGGEPSEESPMKANYFAQSGMLVLSRLDMSIGQEFHVKVVAQPAATAESGKEGKSDGANTSEKSGSEENGGGATAGKGSNEVSKKKKSKFSITGIVGIVVGCAFLAAIVLVFLLRRRHQGYETI
uniref:Maltase n=1 Tax=Hyaloperonospora arabidopsidis (strain Emoy2) TaxID=559515 RepID=M4BPG2_HYAAE